MLRPRRPLLLPLVLAASAVGCVSDRGVDLFPLYRDIETDEGSEFSILWPLSNFEQMGDARTSWTFPFHYKASDERSSELSVPLFPPLYTDNEAPGTSSTQLFPLFSRAVSGARTEDKLLLFLADWVTTESDGLTSLGVLPLFQWNGEPGRSRFAFGHIGGSGPAALVSLYEQETSGLAYYGAGDEPGFRVEILRALGHLVALFHHDTTGSHTRTRLLTLLGIESASLFQRVTPHEGAPGAIHERTVLFPLWWDLREDDTRTRVFWPPYGQTTRGDQTIGHYILFPLLRIKDDPDREFFRTDFIWPLTGRLTEGENSYTWLFPLWRHYGYADGYQWDAILGMFGYKSRADDRELTLLWFPIGL